LPFPAHDALGLDGVGVQHVQDGVTLGWRHVDNALRERFVHKEAALASLGVNANHWVLHRPERSEAILLLAAGVVGAEAVEGSACAMRCLESVDHVLHRCREGRVCVDEVGPQCVAAAGRDLAGGKDGAHWGTLGERDVGVPPVVVAGAIAAAADTQRVVAAVQHQHLWVLIVESAKQGMGWCEVTEIASEGHLLGRSDVLVADEDDAEVEQRGSDRSNLRRTQRGGEVDATDYGTQGAGERLDCYPGREALNSGSKLRRRMCFNELTRAHPASIQSLSSALAASRMIATTMSARSVRSLVALLACMTVGGALGACAPDAGDALTGNAALGQVVAQRSGCMACHGSSGQGGSGPKFIGLAGSIVRLQDGTTTVADDAYLTEATRDPAASRTAGYSGVMPVNTLTATEIAQVVAYIKALSESAGVSQERDLRSVSLVGRATARLYKSNTSLPLTVRSRAQASRRESDEVKG